MAKLGKIYSLVLILFLFFITLLFPTKSLASTWTRMPATTKNMNWVGITGSSDGKNLAAINQDGYIYTSYDYGATWIPRIAPGMKFWSFISSSSDGSVILVSAGDDLGGNSEGDYIYLSTDYGITFTKQTSLGVSYWGEVAVSSDGNTLVVMNDDENIYNYDLYVSKDRGETWQKKMTCPENGIEDGYCYNLLLSDDGNQMVVAGTDGITYYQIVLSSPDSGESWSEYTQDSLDILRPLSFAMSGSRIYQIVEDSNWEAAMYYSTNYGEDWTQIEGIPASFNLVNDIKSIDGGQKIYVLLQTKLYYSSNYGGDWDLLHDFDTEGISASSLAVSADGSRLAINSPAGFIYTSADSGETWTDNSGGAVGGRWQNVDFSSDGSKMLANGFSSENASEISYSKNGGQNWYYKTISTPDPTNGHSMPAIISPDGSKEIVSIPTLGYGSHIFWASDPAGEWSEGASNAFQWEDFSYSPGTDTLFGVAGPADYYLYSSTDWGQNWTAVTSAGQKYWYRVSSSSDGTKIMAIPRTGVGAVPTTNYIFYSSDSGLNWNQLTNAGSRTWKSIVISPDGSKMYAADRTDDAGYIYTSVDGGTTWSPLTNAGERYWTSVSCSTDGATLIASTGLNQTYPGGDYIYTSVNSGSTWTQEVSLGKGDWQDAKVSPDGTKFIVANNGGFVYTGSSDGVLSSASEALASAEIESNLPSIGNQSQACGLYFEKEGVGRIEFATCPDLTDPVVLSWLQNIKDAINLSHGTIGLDADLVQGFISTRATLTMYNINMSNPQILVNGAPDSGNIVSHLTYNSNNHTLTFNAAHFTTFTVVDGGSSDSNSLSSASASSNGGEKPASAPNLFQVNTGKTWAKLFFSPISNTGTYYISYSTSPNAEGFGTGIVNLSSMGVQNYTVNALKANTTYYFKVRGQKGDVPGDWSNIMKIKTGGSVYYKNQISSFISSKITANSTKQTTASVQQPTSVGNSKTPSTTQTYTQPSEAPQVTAGSPKQSVSFWQKVLKFFGLK